VTIVAFTTVYPNPGVTWEDVQKLTMKACDLARKHGAEEVTVQVTVLGGPASNTIGVLASGEYGGRFHEIEQALLNDPEMQAVLQEAGQLATWESSVGQGEPGRPRGESRGRPINWSDAGYHFRTLSNL
jgi:hypothetical protein